MNYICYVPANHAAQLLSGGHWIAVDAVGSASDNNIAFGCQHFDSAESLAPIVTRIDEVREVETNEAAQLLRTGEWIAVGAAIGPGGSIKFFACGHLGAEHRAV